MKLEQSNLIVKRAYKEVYKCDEGIVKVFEKTHSKADVFNEALNTARVEEAGLDIPKVKSVTEIDGKWAVVIEYKDTWRDDEDRSSQYREVYGRLCRSSIADA